MRVWTLPLAAVLLLGGCPAPDGTGDPPAESTLLIFHNNSGPMCLDALAWLARIRAEYPALAVEEQLTYAAGAVDRLRALEAKYGTSEGVSSSFTTLPIVFFGGRAFSGFDDSVRQSLEDLIVTREVGP